MSEIAVATVESAAGVAFDATTAVVVVGAGAAGLIAALAARESGAEVVVLERDATARGSTALSAGLIPAAGTSFQAKQGLADGVEQFRADILAKSHGTSDPTVLHLAVTEVGPALDWLGERYHLAFDVIADFKYPGHSAFRMHGLARRTGSELIDALRSAAESAGVDIVTGAHVTTLFHAGADRVAGLSYHRGGRREKLAADALVLACNGYGGNAALVARHLPDLNGAIWFGHAGNQGEAALWGEALGCELRHMSGHQGHGSVAVPHGILISWATMTEGGFQVNDRGLRFSDESGGYSEQGARVMRQPGGLAWSIFDQRIAGIAAQFEDFRIAEAQGAIVRAESVVELATRLGLPEAGLAKSFAEIEAAKRGVRSDAFGRRFPGAAQPLAPPYCAVKVTGALFHTQGGLAIDSQARVLRKGGEPLVNLFAAGGAAVGVSGPDAAGYLSGNGLLTAVALGRVAGREAAAHARSAAGRVYGP
jgi:fumarate reductase flavoprotein subunit